MLTEKLEIKVFTLNYIQKSDTNMGSYLSRGNGSHVWLFYDLLPQFDMEMFQRKLLRPWKYRDRLESSAI